MAAQDQWPTQVNSQLYPELPTVVNMPAVANEPAIRAESPRARTALRPTPPATNVGRSLAIGLAILAAAGLGMLAAALLFKNGHAAKPAATTSPRAQAVGSATRHVAIPAVEGFNQQTATGDLRAAGLSTKIRVRKTGPADGAVVSQQPVAASRVAAGTTVTILIDRAPGSASNPKAVTTTSETTTTAAPKPASVPQITGMAEQAAVQSLYEAAVVPIIVFVPSHDELGTVEGQAKPSGTQVVSQTPMQITVSRGPGKNPDEIVPSVTGKSLTTALATIQSKSLRLIYLKRPVSTPTRAGTIIDQTPPAGAHAPRNGQVLVYLAAFRPTG